MINWFGPVSKKKKKSNLVSETFLSKVSETFETWYSSLRTYHHIIMEMLWKEAH